MSKENVRSMFGKLEKDGEFQKKYAEAMKAHGLDMENILAGRLVEFGKAEGFAFSKNDLLAARAELIDMAHSNKELGEGDLAKVAGGGENKALAVAVSITGYGVSCAILSYFFNKYEEQLKTNDACKAGLTISGERCK